MTPSRLPNNALLAGLPWLGLSLFIIFAIALLLPIEPNDYWWYVRLGQDILQTQTIPAVDSYSYTQAGQPMVYHSWLAAVFFAGLRQIGGDTLTVLSRGVLLLSFYALSWFTCRSAGVGPKLASLLVFMAAMASSNNWAMRPQLFSFPLFALMLLLLWRWQQGERRGLWLLPLAMLLWVNLHGAFVLGFLLVGAALVGGGGDRWQLALLLGAMVLASLLNPRFSGSWSYVFTLLSDPPSQQLGAEWHPPTNETWQGIIFFAWLLLLIPLAAFSPARLKVTQWLWFLGFGWMAMSGLRYVIWFIAVLVPITGVLLKPLVGHWFDRRLQSYPALDIGFVAMLLALPLALLPGLRERWWAASPPVLTANTPVAAAQWLQTNVPPNEHVWSDLAFSSYLIYATPDHPVWIDTRFELYPLTHWEDYVKINEAGSGWADYLNRDQVIWLLLNPKEQNVLIAAVEANPNWVEQYRDETAVIFKLVSKE